MRYDLMNNIMSFGIHHFWKRQFIDLIPKFNNFSLLDMSCGTGDIVIKFIKKNRNLKNLSIFACDPNAEMLNIAKTKAINENCLNINWIKSEAENLLTFKNESVDCYTISFGIRNVSDRKLALSEANRVLKKGGIFLCLEFGHIEDSLFKKIYDLYSFSIIPYIGKKVTKNGEAYKYLVDSIRNFPSKEVFKQMLYDSGFDNVSSFDMTKGIVNIYSGIKKAT